MKNKELELFLEELKILKDKYGFTLEGCWHCGYPQIRDANGRVVSMNIWYDSFEDCYFVSEVEEVEDLEDLEDLEDSEDENI